MNFKIRNTEFSGYYFYIKINIKGDFQICIMALTIFDPFVMTLNKEFKLHDTQWCMHISGGNRNVSFLENFCVCTKLNE